MGKPEESEERVVGVFWHGFPETWSPVYTHTLRMMKGVAGRRGRLVFLTNKKDLSEPSEELTEDIHVKRTEFLLRRTTRFPGKFILFLKWVLLFQLGEIRRCKMVYVRDLLFSTLAICKLLGKPLVLEKNDVDEAAPHAQRNWMGQLTHRLRFRALDFVDIIIVQTDESKTAHQRMGIPSRKLVVVPNGVDTNLFSFSERPIPHNVRLLYVAHLDENKSLDITMTVAKDMHGEVELTVVGDGPRKAEFENEAKELGLKNVTFVGSVPHDELPRMMSDHDFGIGEYDLDYKEFRDYGFFFFPLKILECLSCGRPVFVNASNAVIRELERSGVVFGFQRKEDVIRTLNSLRLSSQKVLETQRKARRIALKYDWERAVDTLLEKLDSRGIL
ncbi:MAG: glycosyltransferase [Thermoplasmata archaeon]